MSIQSIVKAIDLDIRQMTKALESIPQSTRLREILETDIEEAKEQYRKYAGRIWDPEAV
jgi:hypothetical protein